MNEENERERRENGGETVSSHRSKFPDQVVQPDIGTERCLKNGGKVF